MAVVCRPACTVSRMLTEALTLESVHSAVEVWSALT